MNTIFLDRDGVINKDEGYVHNWDNFKFIDGSLKALQLLTKNSFNIIIVTNQSGIARGFYTEIDFQNLCSKFLKFCSQNKIKIMDTFYCPHHIDGVISKYIKSCKNRKPEPGMFYKASKLYNIKLKTCIMVGDNITDIIASNKVGIKENYLVDDKNKNFKSDINLNFKFKTNLLAATKEILKNKIN